MAQQIQIMDFSTPATALEWATVISKSKMCPKEYAGRPEDILVCMQYGSEVGLSRMQSLYSIAVINGKPCLYGDGLLAVCMRHPAFLDMHEHAEIINGEPVATCTVIRKGFSKPVVRDFDRKKAIQARLWGSSSPWNNYPWRMLQMRARGFALRDAFADALKGFIILEEAMDYPQEKVIQSVREDTPLSQLQNVIFDQNITDARVNRWLERFNVQRLEQIPIDGMNKILLQLNSNGEKNGV